MEMDARLLLSYLPSVVKGLPATEQEGLIGDPYLTSTLPQCGGWKSILKSMHIQLGFYWF